MTNIPAHRPPSPTRQRQIAGASWLGNLLLLLIYRISCDVFGWQLSPLFANYGVSIGGTPFSPQYWTSLGICLAVGGLYAALLTRRLDVLDVGVLLLFLLTFVPTSTVWWITAGSGEYFAFVTTFWALALTAQLGIRPKPWRPIALAQSWPLSYAYAAVLAILGTMLYVRFGLPSALGFDSSYERRGIFSEWLPGGLFAYLFAWAVYVFGIYLLFAQRNLWLKLLAIAIIVLLYGASGDKVYVLLVAMAIFVQVVSSFGLAWIMAPVISVAALASIVAFHSGEIWIPTVMQRLLVLPSDISFHYIKTFEKPLYYGYSFLKSLFDYPYDKLPAQIIGDKFYTVGDNATANFLTDLFVNVGWLGLIPPLLLLLLLRAVFRPGSYLIVLLPLFVALIDTPLPTTLLTNGGVIMIAEAMILAWLGSRTQPDTASQPPVSRGLAAQ